MQLNEALALVNDVRGVGDHSRRSLDAHRGVVVDARFCTRAEASRDRAVRIDLNEPHWPTRPAGLLGK